MRGLTLGLVGFCSLFLSTALESSAQQAPDAFHWVDFHSDKDQSVVAWVTHSLAAEDWTAIREIGVEYDSALVVTSQRSNSRGGATGDMETVWSASLTTHQIFRLLQGSNLRMLAWAQLATSHPRELAVLYNDCTDCNPSTFFTVFYYDITQHGWSARWLHGNQAVAVRNATPPQGVQWTQVFSVLANPNGDEFAATWTHFDYGTLKPAEDYLYKYDVDPWTGLDRVQPVTDKQASALEPRLCSAQDAIANLSSGQDSELCRGLLHPAAAREIHKPCACAEPNGEKRPTR